MWAEVALSLDSFKLFTYKINNNKAVPGTRVLVPVKRRITTGIIISLSGKEPAFKTKDIIEVLDNEPFIDEKLLKLIKWASDYYVYPVGKILNSIYPKSFKKESERYILKGENFDNYSPDKKYIQLIEILNKKEKIREKELLKLKITSKSSIKKLADKNIVNIEDIIPSITRRNTDFIHLNTNTKIDIKLTPVEKKIIDFLMKNNGISLTELRKNIKSVTKKHMEKLTVNNIIYIKDNQEIRSKIHTIDNDFILSQPQQEAFKEVVSSFKNDDITLLHGVTGSGKTMIYIKLIDKILEKGESVIYLVPEISLTTQITGKLFEHFGDKIAIFHSKMTKIEREKEYLLIKEGQKRVIIGVRSAIFAPVQNLGLIVIDEEHETSYKQEEGFLYNAKTVAIKRAKIENAKVLLGSATPSIEVYYAAKQNKISLVKLKQRYQNLPIPKKKIVDMTKNRLFFDIFSKLLLDKLKENLHKKEQSILFINRRGFSPTLICEDCGNVTKCPNCDISLVYHKNTEKLSCHFCNYTQSLPSTCTNCGSDKLKMIGFGTEKVTEVLKTAFPNAQIERFDRDIMTSRGKFEQLIKRMETGEIDILTGTQMVTKGLHFPNVTLVGILLAEQSLLLPDFRGAERTYQFITQLTGRAGRGKKGIAVIQTYIPEHYSIENANEELYESFFEKELKIREESRYPPFTKLLHLLISSKNEHFLEDDTEKVFDFLLHITKENNQIRILGPAPANIFMLRNRYRNQIIIKAPNTTILSTIGKKIRTNRDKILSGNSEIKINIEPYYWG